MSKSFENIKGLYESMSCELKCAVLLGLANVMYFLLYVFDTNWLSFLLTKAIIFLFIGMAKASFLGMKSKR
jgi:hypothetical protein